MQQNVDNVDFWESRYMQQRMPWNIGQVAPAFIKYIQREQTAKKMAVLGSGLGYDAFFFAQNGFDVHAFDFSESAIKQSNEMKRKIDIRNISFFQKDFFKLKNDQNLKHSFDYVLEHTSLCAINPKRREEYIDIIDFLLKPGGKLIGLFFTKDELGGPPYGISDKEIRALLIPRFKEIEDLHVEECLHTNLQGYEVFGVFEKVN